MRILHSRRLNSINRNNGHSKLYPVYSSNSMAWIKNVSNQRGLHPYQLRPTTTARQILEPVHQWSQEVLEMEVHQMSNAPSTKGQQNLHGKHQRHQNLRKTMKVSCMPEQVDIFVRRCVICLTVISFRSARFGSNQEGQGIQWFFWKWRWQYRRSRSADLWGQSVESPSRSANINTDTT